MALGAGLSCELHRTEGHGPDMHARIADLTNKTTKLQ